MSYSLMLVRVPPGVSSDEEVEKLADAASEAERTRLPGPPDPEIERRKGALVEALLEECPELEGGEVDHAALARGLGISEDESRQQHHWWQVVSPEEGAAIQITLYDSYVDIDASRVSTDEDWEDLWQYLEILVREGGFVVWDPQGPNVVDLAAGPSGDGTRTPRSKPAKPAKPAKRRGGRKRGKRPAGRATEGEAAEPGNRRGDRAEGVESNEDNKDNEDDASDDDERDVEDEDVRRGGAIAALINRIVDEAIAAPLAAAGFRRFGRTWRRFLDDGVIQVVNVQWSTRDGRAEGWFALNAGAYFPALGESIALYPITRSPKEYDCHVRTRPGPPGGRGWTVRVPGAAKPEPDASGWLGKLFSWLDRRADDNATDGQARATHGLREALEQYAFPWLERVSTLRGARDELVRTQRFWAAHASLLLGEREEAARLLTLELARANPEYAETVRAWGRRHGLTT